MIDLWEKWIDKYPIISLETVWPRRTGPDGPS